MRKDKLIHVKSSQKLCKTFKGKKLHLLIIIHEGLGNANEHRAALHFYKDVWFCSRYEKMTEWQRLNSLVFFWKWKTPSVLASVNNMPEIHYWIFRDFQRFSKATKSFARKTYVTTGDVTPALGEMWASAIVLSSDLLPLRSFLYHSFHCFCLSKKPNLNYFWTGKTRHTDTIQSSEYWTGEK